MAKIIYNPNSLENLSSKLKTLRLAKVLEKTKKYDSEIEELIFKIDALCYGAKKPNAKE